MSRGRPRKQGKRTKAGQLSRAGQSFDHGSDWVRQRKERFGEHYSSALGRAYAAGLLGEPERAKELLDAGKRFSRIYRSIIGGDAYRCALNDNPRGGEMAPGERDEDNQRWLFAAMDSLDVDGSRPWLDALLTTENTDRGPVWLDRLLMGRKDPYDRAMLAYAVRALTVIAPTPRRSEILVTVY